MVQMERIHPHLRVPCIPRLIALRTFLVKHLGGIEPEYVLRSSPACRCLSAIRGGETVSLLEMGHKVLSRITETRIPSIR